MPRKPPKKAPKRVKRPKAPKTRLVTDTTLNGQPASGLTFTGSTTPAPKTRVEVDWSNGKDKTVWCASDKFGNLAFGDTKEQAENMLKVLQSERAQPIAPQPLSRWSRLWAWLDGFRWGRP